MNFKRILTGSMAGGREEGRWLSAKEHPPTRDGTNSHHTHVTHRDPFVSASIYTRATFNFLSILAGSIYLSSE